MGVPNRFSGSILWTKGFEKSAPRLVHAPALMRKRQGASISPCPEGRGISRPKINYVFPFTYMKIEKLGQVHSDHALREEG
jgi:hypothetical protein